MAPEALIKLIDYSIIVLVVTILYCLVLIPVRAYRITKGMERRERKFMNSVYFKLKKKEWGQLNEKVSDNVQLEEIDGN